MSGAGNIDGVVCFSSDPWADVKRPRQLMKELAVALPVLYVEAPVSVASLVKGPSQLGTAESRARWRRALGGGCEQVGPSLRVMTPLTVIPEHRLSMVPWLGVRNALRRRVRSRTGRRALRAARRLGMSAPVIWFEGHPVSPKEMGLHGNTLVVYDCIDRWSAFPGAKTDEGWRTREAADERELLDRADLVFCSARGLFDSARQGAKGRVALLRNAADVAHFSRAGRPVPAELAELPRPLVGYVGALAEWVDLELVRSAAMERPDWSFVLVGPVFAGPICGDASGMGLIEGIPNVHVLGPRPYHDLPAIVESFDVAIIPFKVNPLTEDTNPIKAYEYLAAGVPVVSTPLPEMLELPVVRIAGDTTEFVREIESALQEREDLDLRLKLTAVAEENSWSARARAAQDEMEAVLVEKTAEHDPPRRPRVLAIASDIPWPLNFGWRIRQFETLLALSAFADLTLISFTESNDPSADLAALRTSLPGARVLDPVHLRIHIKENLLRVAQAELAGLVTGRPYKVAKFTSSEMRRRLRALLEAEAFDVLHVELGTLPYADMLLRGKTGERTSVVLDTHNVESKLLMDHCGQGQFGVLGPAVRMECMRTARFEKEACSRADLVLTISEEDRIDFLRMTGGVANIVTLPPSMAGSTTWTGQRARGGKNVLFVGLMSWLPNQESVRWLCDEVVPLLRARGCDARVQVAGGGAPSDLVQLMRSSGIEPLGYVPDLAGVYDSAGVFAAPFLTGGGVRLKLLEAMREGVPIVTTTTGAKGLAVSHGEQMLIADTPDAFTDAVMSVLSDASLADSLALRAKEYMAAHHSRAAAAALLEKVYAELPRLVARESGASGRGGNAH